MDDFSGTDEAFGSVDGSAAGLEGFLEFDSSFGDISLKPTDRSVRVLVGRRGSGKSRYLRALELDANHPDDPTRRLLVLSQRDEPIIIGPLRTIHVAYPDHYERLELWRRIWGCAIYASIASGMVNFAANRAGAAVTVNIEEPDRVFFERFLTDFLQGSKSAFPVVAALNQFLNSNPNRSKLHQFAFDPIWNEVEERLIRVIANSTPVACYLDSLDDNYGACPAEATDCQVGLLLWVLSKASDPVIGGRMHVVVTVRDAVYSAFMETEHGARYDGKSVRRLDWSRRAAGQFLDRKVAALSATVLVKPRAKDLMERWLGNSDLQNPARDNATESYRDYLLRHTRFLPREIIEIGNKVSVHTRAMSARSVDATEDDLLHVILGEATLIGERALRAAFDNLIAIDDSDRPKSRRDVRAGGIPHVHETLQPLMLAAFQSGFLGALRVGPAPRRGLIAEYFGPEQLLRADRAFVRALSGWRPARGGKGIRVSTILWRHGLLGFEALGARQAVIKYFSVSGDIEGYSRSELPFANTYVLHSSLLKQGEFLVASVPPRPETAAAG